MPTIHDELRDAFEAHGYDVIEASFDRNRVRVGVLADGPNPEALKAIVTDVIDETELIGFNVATEAIGGRDEIATVVSFRHRS